MYMTICSYVSFEGIPISDIGEITLFIMDKTDKKN